MERWGGDPNQYVADEEDDFSTVRQACSYRQAAVESSYSSVGNLVCKHETAAGTHNCVCCYDCRAAGEMLLDELFEAFEGEVAAPLAAAVAARLQVAGRCWAVHGALTVLVWQALQAAACSACRVQVCKAASLSTEPCTHQDTSRHSKLPPMLLCPSALQEAAAARAAGREDWWKLREAVLYGVGTVSDHLLSLAAGGGRGLPLDVPGLMASIVQVLGWL